MWPKSVAALALCQIFNPLLVNAAATWPSSYDEIEDLMMVQSGYRARTFAKAVTPCSNEPIKGFRTAAGFIRTAFHDAAAFNAASGSDGLDGSIGFELGAPYNVHNTGPGFNATVAYMSEFFNSKASMADLIALGVYASVRSCGGPQIAMKAGRIDATGPGPNALPDSADSKEVLVGRFAKMGFSPTEMIQLVACGHTLGGVHPGANTAVTNQNPAKAASQGVLVFDTTDAGFDNKVVTEYLDGSTRNPLVIGTGPQEALNSDKRVFQVDNNVTIRAMASSNTYQGSCQIVMQKMIENVPSNVKLSETIQAYDVKPGQLNLNVIESGAALAFSGEVRIRTSQMSVSKVQIVYKGRNGDSGTIASSVAGTAAGFDESFAFYGFSGRVTSISSFSVVVTTSSGQVRTFDNNGNGYPVNDGAFVQVSGSSLQGSNLNVVVAVRSGQSGQPEMKLSLKNGFKFNSLPTISTAQMSVNKVCGDDSFTYYTGTYNVPASQIASGKLDVSVGGIVVDGFRNINFGSSGTVPKCGGKTSSSTTVSSTSSSTISLSSTVSASTSSSYSSLTSTSLTSSSLTSTSLTSKTSVSATLISTSLSSSLTSTSSNSYTDTSSNSYTDTSSSSTESSSSSLSTIMTTTESASTSSDEASSTTIYSSTAEDVSSTTSAYNGDVTSTSTWTNEGTSTTEPETSSYDAPNWTAWDPAPPGPTASIDPSATVSGWESWPTPVDSPDLPGNDADALLSSIYQDNYNEPAPSDGTDGGNKNVEGLDLSITVDIVTPTITGPTAVGDNGYSYVEVTGTPSWAPADVPSGTVAATWAPADVPAGTATSGGKATASSTKSGPIGKFTGAANSVAARGEIVMMGAAAVMGAVAFVL